MMLIGGHFPISGGFSQSLRVAHESGANCIQFFTRNPGQWKAKPIPADSAEEFRRTASELGISPLIVHDSYLINLATSDKALLEKSRRAFIEEVERADMLGASHIVTHMGTHRGMSIEEGLAILSDSIRYILDKTSGSSCSILLETTAGQGTQLGHRFCQLGKVIEKVGANGRVGVCLDTCHVFVSGYDISTPEGLNRTMDEFQSEIGLDRLKVIHMNDTGKELGSRVDRHEFIGRGKIGIGTFENIVRNPLFRNTPLILETREPEKMHRVYIKMLKSFIGG